MKIESVIFVPSIGATEWLLEHAPAYSPAEMPIAGLRIIDYQLENALRAGAVLLEIIDWHYDKRLAAEYSNSEDKGYSVFYEKWEGDMPRGLDDLKRIKSPLTSNMRDGLLVVWGPCLHFATDELDMSYESIPGEECAETPIGVYVLRGGKWMRLKPRGRVLDSVQSWHAVNLEVLRDPGHFTIPGYSAEEGVHIGRNVVMEHGTEVSPPVVLRDNVWCARNVSLAGDVVIGKQSFVAEGTRLCRTMICDNTIVGQGLDLTDKIVVGHRIIDGKTGAWTDVDDDGIASPVQPVKSLLKFWLKPLWRFFLGASHGGRFK